MKTTVDIHPVTDDRGKVIAGDWLLYAEAVHRQLRPGLPEDYVGRLMEVFAGGGRMVVAAEAGEVHGLAIWRLIENTYEGRRLYVDDLVTDEQRRSRGVGKALLCWLEAHARELGCDMLALDSGVQRSRAHAFYFREGMTIASFTFRKAL